MPTLTMCPTFYQKSPRKRLRRKWIFTWAAPFYLRLPFLITIQVSRYSRGKIDTPTLKI